MKFRVLSDAELVADAARIERERIAAAWRAWHVESCVERNGGHAWMLSIDGGSMDLSCDHGCPAMGDDIAPYSYEAFTARIPVVASVHTEGSCTAWSDDWSLWIELEPR